MLQVQGCDHNRCCRRPCRTRDRHWRDPGRGQLCGIERCAANGRKWYGAHGRSGRDLDGYGNAAQCGRAHGRHRGGLRRSGLRRRCSDLHGGRRGGGSGSRLGSGFGSGRGAGSGSGGGGGGKGVFDCGRLSGLPASIFCLGTICPGVPAVITSPQTSQNPLAAEFLNPQAPQMRTTRPPHFEHSRCSAELPSEQLEH